MPEEGEISGEEEIPEREETSEEEEIPEEEEMPEEGEISGEEEIPEGEETPEEEEISEKEEISEEEIPEEKEFSEDMDSSALDKMNQYMSEHNYGKEDAEIYKKDPEWQKLNEELLKEDGEDPVEIIAENEEIKETDKRTKVRICNCFSTGNFRDG